MNDTASPEPLRGRSRHVRADDLGASSGKVISVLLIDDSRFVREGIATLLSRSPDVRVAASDSKLYATLMEEGAPDVVLLEPDLFHATSMVIARALRRDHPDTRVILMDHIPAREDTVAFIEAGVCGFIHKHANLCQVLLTIRSVASGLDVLPGPLVGSLFFKIASEADTADDGQGTEWVRLTDREREVLHLIGKGLSNKAIAKRLRISIYTVKSHLRNTMEKLTLHSRLELAGFAHKHSDLARSRGSVSVRSERCPSALRLRSGLRRTGGSSRRSADLV